MKNLNIMNTKIYIQRCLQLAKNGLGTTYPNPLVGAVIIWKSKIIGEGFHFQSGQPHAEVIAIQSVKNQILLQEATLYVNLEPCSHFGKTPPCVDLIIEKKIPKVIIGMKDPNLLVGGQGIKKLKLANIQVKTLINKKECIELNKRFITFHTKHRPYIFLKFAKSLDGLFKLNHNKRYPFYISNKYSLQYVHYRRTQEQGILIGKNTAIQDNPRLDTRMVGNIIYPIRIILDRNLEIINHFNLNILNNLQKTWIFNTKKNKIFAKVECIKIDQKNFLRNVLYNLYKRNIQSIIVEGGISILKSFISENVWDEAEIYTGSFFIKQGIKAPSISGKLIERYKILEDEFIRIKNL